MAAATSLALKSTSCLLTASEAQVTLIAKWAGVPHPAKQQIKSCLLTTLSTEVELPAYRSSTSAKL